MAWFLYNSPLSISSPSSYTKVPGMPQLPPNCSNGPDLCAIEAESLEGTDLPDLDTEGLQDSIIAAFANDAEQFPQEDPPRRGVKMKTQE